MGYPEMAPLKRFVDRKLEEDFKLQTCPAKARPS